MKTDASETAEMASPARKEGRGEIVSPQTLQSYGVMGFWLIALVLFTLIFSAVRDIAALNEQIGVLDTQNAPGLELLKRSSKQEKFVERLHTDLQQLAETNSTAAQLLKEYFGSPAAPAPSTKPAGLNTNSAPANLAP